MNEGSIEKAAAFDDKTIKAQFGRNLSRLRKLKGLSRKQLAAEMGLSEITIASYEGGLRQPAYSIMFRLTNFFNVTVDEMLGHYGITQGEIVKKYRLDKAINLLANVGRIVQTNKGFALLANQRDEVFKTDAAGNVVRVDEGKDGIFFSNADDLIEFAEGIQRMATFSTKKFETVFYDVAENLFTDAESIKKGKEIFAESGYHTLTAHISRL